MWIRPWGLFFACITLAAPGKAQMVPQSEIVWLEGAPDSASIRVGVAIVETPDGHYLAGSLESPYPWAEFDADGQFVGLYGRRGQGPGEFQFITALSPIDDEHVAVMSSSRVTLMTRGGQYVDSRPVPTLSTRFMTDSLVMFSQRRGVYTIRPRVEAGELTAEVTLHEAMPFPENGRIPTIDLMNGEIVTLDAEGNGYSAGKRLPWNALTGTTSRFQGDEPAHSVVAIIVSGGALQFSIRQFDNSRGIPGPDGSMPAQDIRLWDHRGPEPRQVQLPPATVPFYSGSVLGVVRRDQFGVARVGILRRGINSIQG